MAAENFCSSCLSKLLTQKCPIYRSTIQLTLKKKHTKQHEQRLDEGSSETGTLMNGSEQQTAPFRGWQTDTSLSTGLGYTWSRTSNSSPALSFPQAQIQLRRLTDSVWLMDNTLQKQDSNFLQKCHDLLRRHVSKRKFNVPFKWIR